MIIGAPVDAVLLSAQSIAKSFAGARALDGVSLDVRAGEVHALVGENGAGKSTLIKIMTGAEAPDRGTITIGGRALSRLDPAAAHALGIAAVYQQPALFPHLTVTENLAIGSEAAAPWRRIDWPARRARARHLLAKIGASLDPDRTVDTLTMPEQQMVEIARALGADARVLILDEPTASLTTREVDALLDLVRRLRAQGVGILYISHRLDEVLAIADRITVLRDGRTVGTEDGRSVSAADLIARMVGDELHDPPAPEPRREQDVALEILALSNRRAGIADVSLAVRRGEILGLAGLVGSGRTQLAETIFGITPADAGEIRIAGRTVAVRDPAEAIAAGIAYVPEDRRRHGVVLEMSVAANRSMASLAAVARRGLIDFGAERAAAARDIAALRITPTSPLAEAATLSGGNQQKVAIARWLATSAVGADSRRADAGRGCPGQGRDPSHRPPARGTGARRPADLVRPSRAARAQRSRCRDARRHDCRDTGPGGGIASGGARACAWRRSAEARVTARETAVAASLGALAIVMAMVAPAYFAPGNLRDLLLSNLPVLIVAIGSMLVILTGEIDISCGSMFAICSVVAGMVAKETGSVALAFLAAVSAGITLGSLAGLAVAYGRIPSIVVTLAMLVALRDGLRWATGGAWVTDLPRAFQWFGLNQEFYPLVAGALAIGLCAVTAWVLRGTAGGRWLYAVGSNAGAARLAGIRVERVKVATFALAGALTATAAVVNAARFSQVPSNTGLGLEMKVVAAVVVGGAAVTGGVGTIRGTVLGVLLLGAIGPALTFMGVTAYWERALQGAIILAAVGLDAWRTHRASQGTGPLAAAAVRAK